jgi:hypothetical protein
VEEPLWTEHITSRHTLLIGQIKGVRLAIIDPDVIRLDATSPIRHNYYRIAAVPEPYSHRYLKVCVEFANGPNVGRVITAHITSRLKKQERHLWP